MTWVTWVTVGTGWETEVKMWRNGSGDSVANVRGGPPRTLKGCGPASNQATARARQRGVGAWALLKWVAVLSVVVAGATAASLAWWVHKPLAMPDAGVEVSIESGTSPREIAQLWVQAGLKESPWLLFEWFKWSGQSKRIRAGGYLLQPGASANDLLQMMVRGDEHLASVRFIEGWTFARMREEMAHAPGLQATTAGLSDDAIMAQLGEGGGSPEGQFFPDTYSYAKGSKDSEVLARAHRAMLRQLQRMWAQRAPTLPLSTPQDALVLASLVEKETGKEADRQRVAAVFINRLRLHMPLQTDPSVIYGLGARYDGHLHKSDLQTDSAYNTYMRSGLPPTPIAMPGKASLFAALNPANSSDLYFVARGDGSSEFSSNLVAHNRAVNRFLRKAGEAGQVTQP